MFTLDNTEGFTPDEIARLNEALAVRRARGEDTKAASDAVNNAWLPGATLADLTRGPDGEAD